MTYQRDMSWRNDPRYADFPNENDKWPNWSLSPRLDEKIVIDGDATEILALIAEAGELASALELRETLGNFVHEHLADGGVYSSELLAGRAARVEVLIHPGKWFLEILAALRAGDRDGFLALCSAHGDSSQ